MFLLHFVDFLCDALDQFVDGRQVLRVNLLLLLELLDLSFELLLLLDQRSGLLDLLDLLDKRVFRLSGHASRRFQAAVQDLLALI